MEVISPSPLLFARILLAQWGVHVATLKNKCISADTFQVVYLVDSLSPLPKAVFWLKEKELMQHMIKKSSSMESFSCPALPGIDLLSLLGIKNHFCSSHHTETQKGANLM